MERATIKHANILAFIDKLIKKYCERQNIKLSAFAYLLGIGESSLRGKRRGDTEFTLFEVLQIEQITSAEILPRFDEQITAEPQSEYKVTNKIDNLPHSDKIEKIKEAIPAPVFNYYITIK